MLGLGIRIKVRVRVRVTVRFEVRVRVRCIPLGTLMGCVVGPYSCPLFATKVPTNRVQLRRENETTP